MTKHDYAAASKWVDRKLNLHKNYIDTFKDYEDSHTARQVRHKTRQAIVLEACQAALKAQIDATPLPEDVLIEQIKMLRFCIEKALQSGQIDTMGYFLSKALAATGQQNADRGE